MLGLARSLPSGISVVAVTRRNIPAGALLVARLVRQPSLLRVVPVETTIPGLAGTCAVGGSLVAFLAVVGATRRSRQQVLLLRASIKAVVVTP